MSGGWGDADPAPPVRPRSVDLAVRLMYAGAVVSVLSGIAALFQDRDALRESIRKSLSSSGQDVTQSAVDNAITVGIVASLVVGLVVAGVWVLMGVFNGRGRSWARLVATVLGLVNVVFTITGLVGAASVTGAGGGLVSTLLSLVNLVLAAVILFLLWKRESSDYFAAVSAR